MRQRKILHHSLWYIHVSLRKQPFCAKPYHYLYINHSIIAASPTCIMLHAYSYSLASSHSTRFTLEPSKCLTSQANFVRTKKLLLPGSCSRFRASEVSCLSRRRLGIALLDREFREMCVGVNMIGSLEGRERRRRKRGVVLELTMMAARKVSRTIIQG